MFRTTWSYIGENRKLKDKIKQLDKQLLLSESQNYCKICGKTLDGYKSKGEINVYDKR